MDVFVSLFYAIFVLAVVYPPTEFASAGFTIPQIFENVLGSENNNFISYHMKRITLTVFIQSMLPLGYVFCLWLSSGLDGLLLQCLGSTATLICGVFTFKLVSWWEQQTNNPVVKNMLPYVEEGSDWRILAANINLQYRSIDKFNYQMSTTSKFLATEIWLIHVSQYNVIFVKQEDCELTALTTDIPNLSSSEEEEMQYMNIKVTPTRDDVSEFYIRIPTAALRELQSRLLNPVMVPEHLSLEPTIADRFVNVFKQCMRLNPVFYIEQEPELCIGCMQEKADVKLNKRCQPTPNPPTQGQRDCQQCNCRVLWCSGCMARWWSSRCTTSPSEWLSAKCTCPVCRSVFCMLDVSLAVKRS